MTDEEIKEFLKDDNTAEIVKLVDTYFNDMDTTLLWMQIDNPLLGSIPPIDMIKQGRHEKLKQFVETALDEL